VDPTADVDADIAGRKRAGKLPLLAGPEPVCALPTEATSAVRLDGTRDTGFEIRDEVLGAVVSLIAVSRGLEGAV
jgi:hypothetical protein